MGQDGGQSIDIGDQSLFVFSDTLFAPRRATPRLTRPPYPVTQDGSLAFLANCAALANGGEMREALAAKGYYEDEEGMPRQIIEADAEEAQAGIRFWPAHGIYLEGAVYLYYLGIQQHEGPSVWSFSNIGVGLARFDPLSGCCQRIRQDGDWRLWGPHGDDFHLGVQALLEGEYVYLFGSVREGLEVKGIVARVPRAQIVDPGAYRYLQDSGGEWGDDIARAATLGPCGSDYSVSFNRYLQRYLLIYIDAFTKTLWLRTAQCVAGPYSAPQFVGRVPHDEGSELVYLAHEHPRFAGEGGRRIYVSYCQPLFAPNSLLEVRFQ